MIDRKRARSPQTTVALFLAILIIIAFITQWIDVSIITGSILQNTFHLSGSSNHIYTTDFECSIKCSDTEPAATKHEITSSPESCPEYFRWIHEDLKPWKDTGISREMVEKAKNVSNIRIIILNGRVYVEKYKDGFQTRDAITIWGILQLIRLYPGRIPDLDLMFECDDKTVIKKRYYGTPNSTFIPPLFHYCGDEASYDIVFPDWSFWGWPEVNIKPWEILKEELKESNSRIKWSDREPYAYWKGNTVLGRARRDLVKCNVSEGQDWKARIFPVEWSKEKKQGFNTSDLTNQCTYRYKIYVEGVTWSVSEKYILACDSPSLIIKPRYYDFYTRSLLPSVHYLPINETDKCRSIKSIVDWGNKYKTKAQEIGQSGSNFVQENLKMKFVYDYALHLLNEYAKLMTYKPSVPKGAVEMCSETMICSVRGQRRRFRKSSMVRNPSELPPCSLPPPYEPNDLRAFVERKENLTNQALRGLEL